MKHITLIALSLCLVGCVKGPTQEDMANAANLQSQINQLQRQVDMQPMLPPEEQLPEVEVEAIEEDIVEKEAEIDELLETHEVPVGDAVGAILPWIPPPFNMIGAALIAVSPLVFGRKKP